MTGTQTAALVAEVERLTKELAEAKLALADSKLIECDYTQSIHQDDTIDVYCSCCGMMSEFRRIKQDAERYRWLVAEHDVDLPMARCSWKRNSDRRCGEWVNLIDGDDLSEHIAAAMRRTDAGAVT